MQAFRESGGRLKVWGKAPRKIEARYETGDGKTKTSLLLASGGVMLIHRHGNPCLAGCSFNRRSDKSVALLSAGTRCAAIEAGMMQ